MYRLVSKYNYDNDSSQWLLKLGAGGGKITSPSTNSSSAEIELDDRLDHRSKHLIDAIYLALTIWLDIVYDRDACKEFIGYELGKIKAIGCFKTTITIDRVSAKYRSMSFQTKSKKFLIIFFRTVSSYDDYYVKWTKAENIFLDDSSNIVDKTSMWTKEADVVSKSRVGHMSAVTHFWEHNFMITICALKTKFVRRVYSVTKFSFYW